MTRIPLTIVVEGGLVQGIVTDTDESAALIETMLDIQVRDWDQDGEPEPVEHYWPGPVEVDQYKAGDTRI